ncbi:unnamed protein product [Didymodactylos carnosus]|uniref:Uncharacterized protein n=1 Tax=Didymodactylos carnosus TaxID=1234261 RepID=A0A8S2Q639_9BILA|nr:unnamed protein product [Didymodactylos carnosus]CAF4082941.1 unnamed protein product [Didymodactylos carnosus]
MLTAYSRRFVNHYTHYWLKENSIMTGNEISCLNEQFNVLKCIENMDISTVDESTAVNEINLTNNGKLSNNEENESIMADKPEDMDEDKFNSCSKIDINKYKSTVDQVSVQLRYIQTSFCSPEELIKQSTTSAICEENFIRRVLKFANQILKVENDLKLLCMESIRKIENDRENITIIETKNNELVNRDPGNYKSGHIFTEEELRYLVSIDPSQPILQHYPANNILAQTKKHVDLPQNSIPNFPI